MYSERGPRILNRLLPEVAPYERPALTKAYIHPPTAKAPTFLKPAEHIRTL